MAGESAKQRWIPLESNPDVLNKYTSKIGVPDEWKFVDILGLEQDLLVMTPQPVLAVMLLYPLTEKAEAVSIGEVVKKSDLYYIKQTIGNACGTIALVHALANNAEKISFISDKHFSNFLAATLSMSPTERAMYLENDKDMGAAHDESAHSGQTQAPGPDEKVNPHFVTLIHHDGYLYELDGRKGGPVCHGPTNEKTFLEDAANVAKKFMKRDEGELNFSLMALAKSA